MIGAYLVRRFTSGAPAFDRLGSAAAFTAAAFVAPFLSTFLDSAFVSFNAWGNTSYWELWKTRFFSNVTTNLTLIPLIVMCASGKIESLGAVRRARVSEAAMLESACSRSPFWCSIRVSERMAPRRCSICRYRS